MNWDWDFLTPEIILNLQQCLHLPKSTTRTTDGYPIALRSDIYRAGITSLVPPNNADQGGSLHPNARLNRNQAHQQGIN